MAQVLGIIQMIESLIPGLLALGTQALQAFMSGDQAKLDALDAQARAAADALKPAGA